MSAVKKLSFALVLGSALVGTSLEAATILRCDSVKQQCRARLEDGVVGSPVDILDEKAFVVAHGFIVKRTGAYEGIIAFKKILSPVKRGYPVIVKQGTVSSNLQWAASFSDKD